MTLAEREYPEAGQRSIYHGIQASGEDDKEDFMAGCVIIADDLTGGNAAGVLLRGMGCRTITLLNPEHAAPDMIREHDCVVCPTNSRGIGQHEAYERVRRACALFSGGDVRLYAHRIDSTLRGNVGSETDAMLDFLGKEYIAAATPAFPASGRTVRDGKVLVHGKLLHMTEIAMDPKAPVHTSDVPEVFRSQSRYGVAALEMDEIRHGMSYLAECLNSLAAYGVRTVTFDCETQEGLELIADAVIKSGLRFISVDPGPLTAAVARRLMPISKGRVLSVVGSVHPNVLGQMEYLWETMHPGSVVVKTREFLESDSAREKEIERAVRYVLEADNGRVYTVTGDGIWPENRLDFAPYMQRYGCTLEEITGRINEALGEIALRIFRADPSFRALYTCGGDVTEAVCRRFGAAGLCLEDEVLPLAACGRFLGGEFRDIHIVTKGGSQGDRTAAEKCIAYLLEALDS